MVDESALPLVMPGLLAWAAARHGERIALRDGDVTLDFIALAARVRGASRAFLAAGIRRGDFVIMIGRESMEATLVERARKLARGECPIELQHMGLG